ncbi:MAG: hypothetical protein ACE5GV_05955 [Candidatus Scalindua sp.]
MSVSEIYKGNFYKGSDFENGKECTLVISDAVIEDLEDRKTGKKSRKIILEFENKQERLALNKTNAKLIAKKLGDEEKEWVGHSIILFGIPTQMGTGVSVRFPKTENFSKEDF